MASGGFLSRSPWVSVVQVSGLQSGAQLNQRGEEADTRVLRRSAPQRCRAAAPDPERHLPGKPVTKIQHRRACRLTASATEVASCSCAIVRGR